jgi:hypothetical protein
MSVDLEREVSAALHDAADDLLLPSLDLTRIRRVGRRRRRVGTAVFATLTVIIAAAAAAGVVRLAGPGPGGGTDASAHHPGRWAVATAAAMANVQAFYSGYQSASRRSKAAVNTLIRARTASWYAPILEAPAGPRALAPVACGHQDAAATLSYQAEGEVSGQFVFVVGSWWIGPNAAAAYNVVIADPASAKITGIACAQTMAAITPIAAQQVAGALYTSYLTMRSQGASVPGALNALLLTEPASQSSYLQQAETAASKGQLAYDPLVCRSNNPSSAQVNRVAKIVAGGTAGLVTITPSGSDSRLLGVVTRSANGWTLADVACPQAIGNPATAVVPMHFVSNPRGMWRTQLRAGAGRHGGS